MTSTINLRTWWKSKSMFSVPATLDRSRTSSGLTAYLSKSWLQSKVISTVKHSTWMKPSSLSLERLKLEWLMDTSWSQTVTTSHFLKCRSSLTAMFWYMDILRNSECTKLTTRFSLIQEVQLVNINSYLIIYHHLLFYWQSKTITWWYSNVKCTENMEKI
jgi:hypothetical protein